MITQEYKFTDVLIPCAGNAQYFEESLLSAINQTHQCVTIYVIDNGCLHDYYRDITNKVGASNVIYIRFDVRLPIALNWQRCLTVGYSPVCAFLHDDDIWPRDYLKTGLTLLKPNKINAVLTRKVHFKSGLAPHDIQQAIDYQRLSETGRFVHDAVLLTSCASHMSALLFVRGYGAFSLTHYVVVDQLFCDHFIIQGTLMENQRVTVLIREHTDSETAATPQARYTCEMQDRILDNLIFLNRRGGIDPADIRSFLSFKDRACFSQFAQACYARPVPKSFRQCRLELLRVGNWDSSRGRLPLWSRLFAVTPEFARACVAYAIRAWRLLNAS